LLTACLDMGYLISWFPRRLTVMLHLTVMPHLTVMLHASS
jgi:hypothetical protein